MAARKPFSLAALHRKVRAVLDGTPSQFSAPASGMRTLLDTVVEVTGQNTTITYTNDELLKMHDIQPVDGVGYWVPHENEGYMRCNVDKVFATGFTERPLKQMMSETLAWLRKDGFKSETLMEKIQSRALTLEKEAEMLTAWKKNS